MNPKRIVLLVVSFLALLASAGFAGEAALPAAVTLPPPAASGEPSEPAARLSPCGDSVDQAFMKGTDALYLAEANCCDLAYQECQFQCNQQPFYCGVFSFTCEERTCIHRCRCVIC